MMNQVESVCRVNSMHTRCIQLIRRGNVSEAVSVLHEVDLGCASPAQVDIHERLMVWISKIHRPEIYVGDNQAGALGVPSGAISNNFETKWSRTIPLGSVIDQDVFQPLPGTSFVAACMNRERNLFKVLPSWLETDVDEIIIVDWSSKIPIEPELQKYADDRIKLIRVEGEKHWILTNALNVGLRCASHEYIFKLDCDICVSTDFIVKNRTSRGEFIRGFWKIAVEAGQEDQRYVNGTFGAYKADLREIGYYDERILSYGWDDTDIYQRLHGDLGLAGRLLDQGSVTHIDQTEEQRLENQSALGQKFLGKFERTEYEAAKNKFYTVMSGGWGKWSDAHDYQLSRSSETTYTVRRIGKVKILDHGLSDLAQTLAIRQLLSWTADFSKVFQSDTKSGTELYKLFRDAHLRGMSQQLHDALSACAGIHFITAASADLLAAVQKTLQLIASHQQNFIKIIVLVAAEDDVVLHAGQPTYENIFFCPKELIKTLARQCHAEEINHMDDVEDVFEGELAGKCRFLNVSAQLICSSSISKAEAMDQGLGTAIEALNAPVADTCLVTSLYDESNLIRLTEYVTCLVRNIGVFERIVILYESRSNLLFDIITHLQQLLSIAIGRLLIIPYKDRPSFAELFSTQYSLPAGTTLAVANADIVFDGTLAKLSMIGMSDKVVVLSRRDINAAGTAATLIRLPNGAPNTFSADSWIVKTPFTPDFHLDYKIGTFHCDSFINNQLSRSLRYHAFNPCFDIHAFHLHDERFNSSSEKNVRDKAEIQAAYGREHKRNDNQDPIRGLSWSTIALAQFDNSHKYYQRWSPKALVVDLTLSAPCLGRLICLHMLTTIAAQLNDVSTCIRLRKSDIATLGGFFGRYSAAFPRVGFLLDIDDQVHAQESPSSNKVMLRARNFSSLVELVIARGINDLTSDVYELLSWPSEKGIDLLRAEVVGGLNQGQIQHLWSVMRGSDHPLARDFLGFLESLPPYSFEERIFAPYISGDELPPKFNLAYISRRNENPNVTFITSLFQGGEFLLGFLENVAYAALECEGEVIIVDANMDDEDENTINEFLSENSSLAPLFQYVKTKPDPGLYGCWRIGIEMARSPYVTNANIDDRRSPSHTRKLASILELNPAIAGACGSIACVRSGGQSAWFSLDPKEIWFHGDSIREFSKDKLFSVDDSRNIISRNIMHCMPVWRKSLHDIYGYFDEERYGTSADWAFWLKCASFGERFIFEQSAFGQYFLNTNSHNRRNDATGEKESRIIFDYFGVDQAMIVKQ